MYALYGEAGDPLIIPPGWQMAEPFGSSIGPVNPTFLSLAPEAQFDSFVTIGVDGPALDGAAISSVGLDFTSWSEQTGMSSENGAVFFMDPNHGATTQPVVFLQLTVAQGTRFSGQLSAQGRSTGTRPQDWTKAAMLFTERGGTAARPPPPPALPVQTDHCWIPPDYVQTPCQNGATCTTVGDSYSCTCAHGYSGTDCETPGIRPPPPPTHSTPPPPSVPPNFRCEDDDQHYLAAAGLSCDSVWEAVEEAVGAAAACEYDIGSYLHQKLSSAIPQETALAEACPVTCNVCADASCNVNDLAARSEAINRECCDEPSEDCSGGYPHTCNPGCATLLLSFWADCQELLGEERRLIESAVGVCEAAGSGTCGDLNERIAGVNIVCCSPPRECTGVEPDICSSECAATFLGTLSDCHDEMEAHFGGDFHVFDGFTAECEATMEACVGAPCLNGGICSTAPPGYHTQVPFRYCAEDDRIALYQWRPEAEAACIADTGCWSLWDEGCNGGEGWWTCHSETGNDAHSEQCLYTAGGLEGGTDGRKLGDKPGAMQLGGHRRLQWVTTCDFDVLIGECQAHPLPEQAPDLAHLCANECFQQIMPCATGSPDAQAMLSQMLGGMESVASVAQVAARCARFIQAASPPPPASGAHVPPRPLCECPYDWYDARCGTYCTGHETCRGQGTCNNDGQCACYPGFSGQNCEIEANPFCDEDCGEGTCGIAVPPDDVTWFSPMGGCDSYAPGQWNSQYCDEDTNLEGFCAGGHCEDITGVGVTAAEACPTACGAPARRMCICEGDDYYWNQGRCVYCDPVETCSGHGVCDTWSDLGSCTCSPGFAGEHCENEINPCEHFDCGQGVCTRRDPPGVIDLGAHHNSGFRRLQTMDPACEQDMHDTGAPVPPGTMLYSVCARTCGTCNSRDPSCVDDADGILAAMPVYGEPGAHMTCAMVIPPETEPEPEPELGRPAPDDIFWTNIHGSCRDYQLGKPGHGHCAGDMDGPDLDVPVVEHCPMSCGYQCVCDESSCSGHGVCDANGVCQCHDGWEGPSCSESWTEETESVDCASEYETVDDPWRNVATGHLGPNGAVMVDVPLFASCAEHESEGELVAAEPTGVGGDSWWRFVGAGGDGLPVSYPGPNHCGTNFGGWLSGFSEEQTLEGRRPPVEYNRSGSYPPFGDVVEKSVCMPNYNAPDDPTHIVPCYDHFTVGVVRCPPQAPTDPPQGFLLWRLPWAEHCYSAYCTADTSTHGGPGGHRPGKGR